MLARALGRGYYPHQLAWLIDNPLRRLLVTPERFANRLPLDAASRILEIGPGSGYFSVALAHRVPSGHLTLLDLQVEMVAKAKRKLHAVGIRNASYATADVNAGVPLRDDSVDAVAMVAVLGEIPDSQGALRSCHRVLRADGILAIHEHVPDPDLIKFELLEQMAETAGFRLRRTWGPRWNYTAVFEKRSLDDAVNNREHR